MELTGDLNFLSELIKIDQESFDEYNLNISEISFAKDERYDDDLHIYFKVEVVNGAVSYTHLTLPTNSRV